MLVPCTATTTTITTTAFLSPPAPTDAAAATCPRPLTCAVLKRYVIVRDIPGIHEKDVAELGSISAASCSALGKAGHGRVQVSLSLPVATFMYWPSSGWSLQR